MKFRITHKLLSMCFRRWNCMHSLISLKIITLFESFSGFPVFLAELSLCGWPSLKDSVIISRGRKMKDDQGKVLLSRRFTFHAYACKESCTIVILNLFCFRDMLKTWNLRSHTHKNKDVIINGTCPNGCSSSLRFIENRSSVKRSCSPYI